MGRSRGCETTADLIWGVLYLASSPGEERAWGQGYALPGQLTYVPNNSLPVLGEDEGGGDRGWYNIVHPVYRTSVENVSEQPSYIHAAYKCLLQDYL